MIYSSNQFWVALPRNGPHSVSASLVVRGDRNWGWATQINTGYWRYDEYGFYFGIDLLYLMCGELGIQRLY